MRAFFAGLTGALLLTAAAAAASSGAARADALDRIAETGEIRFAVREAAAPFSYRDAEGAPAGLAVALCHRIAAALGERLGRAPLRIAHVFVTSETRFDSLTSGEADILCGPTTATLARRAFLDFSVPYFMDGIGFGLRRDGVQALEDLKGEAIGALAGTTAVSFAESVGAAAGSPLTAFPSHEAGLRALGRGEIDVYFGDQGLLLHQLGALKAEDRLLPVRIPPEQLSYEPYALAMRGGERRLRLEVDRALSAVFLSGEVFDDIEAALGPFDLSEFAAFLYVLVALPE